MKSIILAIFFFSAREVERINCELLKHDTPCESKVEPNGHETVVAKPMWDHLSNYPPHLWPKEVEDDYSCEAIIPKKEVTKIPPRIDYPPFFINDSGEDSNDDFPSVVAVPLVPGLPDLPQHMQPNAATVEPPPPEVPEAVSMKPEEPQFTPLEPVASQEPTTLEPLPPSVIISDIILSPHVDKTEIVTNGTTNSGVKLTSGKISAFPAENSTNTVEENEDITKNENGGKNYKSLVNVTNEQKTSTPKINENNFTQDIHGKHKNQKINHSKPMDHNENTRNKTENQETATLKTIEDKQTKDSKVEKGKNNSESQESTNAKNTEEKKDNIGGKNGEKLEKQNSIEKNNNTEKAEEINETHEITTPKATQRNANNKDVSQNENSEDRNSTENSNNNESTERKSEILETTTPKTSQKNSGNKNENVDSRNRNGNGNNVENTERKTENQESTTPNTKTSNNNVEKQEENSSQEASTATNAYEKSKSDITKNKNTENGQEDSSGFGSINGQNPPGGGGGGGSFSGKVLKTGGGIVAGGTITGGIVLGGTAIAGGKGIVDTGMAIGGTIVSGGGGAAGGGGAGGSSTIPEAGESPLNPSRNGETPSNNGRSGNERTQQKTNSNKNERNSNSDKKKKDGKNEDDDLDFDLDEIDEDLFLDYNKFAVEQHTADNISAIFVEKIKRIDYTCDWFITNFTNEVNNLTIFRDKYDGMVAYAAQAPKGLGDKLETETDDNIYNRKTRAFNAAILLEDYLSSLREDISTVSSNLNSFIFYTEQLWNQSYFIQTEIVQEILSATSFTHHIYKDIGKVRLVAQVSKLRLVDCFSSAISAYQNWRIFMKEIYLKAITLERTTYTYLIGKYYNDMRKWDEATVTVSTFVNDATNHTNEVISKFINLRDNTEECVYNITTYVHKKRFKLLNIIKQHLIY